MPFKKGQTVILAVVEYGKITSHIEATVSKGGKDNFYLYGSNSAFSQQSSIRRHDILTFNGKQMIVFANEQEMKDYEERQHLYKVAKAIDSAILTNDQLKAIVAIVSPVKNKK